MKQKKNIPIKSHLNDEIFLFFLLVFRVKAVLKLQSWLYKAFFQITHMHHMFITIHRPAGIRSRLGSSLYTENNWMALNRKTIWHSSTLVRPRSYDIAVEMCCVTSCWLMNLGNKIPKLNDKQWQCLGTSFPPWILGRGGIRKLYLCVQFIDNLSIFSWLGHLIPIYLYSLHFWRNSWL